MLGAAGIQSFEAALDARRGDVLRPADDRVDPFAVGAVGREFLAEAIELIAPGIHEAIADDLQVKRVRLQAPDAAAVESLYAEGRFDVAVDVDRLVHVES